MKKASALLLSQHNNALTLRFEGAWTKEAVASLEKSFLGLPLQSSFSYQFDFSEIEAFDTHGIMLILHYFHRLKSLSAPITLLHKDEHFQKLFEICDAHFPKEELPHEPKNVILDFLENVGKTMIEGYKTLSSFFSFTGELTHHVSASLLNPFSIRLRAMLYHIEQSGAGAIPIILLTSFLIGVVIAYQGATQLEKFGANIFIVEMVTVSAVRELAPLITAIVVAGRSASAYTAQIGVMKITDEVDAMRSMGFSPWGFLVLPRLFALMISLPLLVFFADVVSVFGGMVVASSRLDVNFVEFIDRIKETVALKHLIIGLVKAPIFGAIIATIGCFRGFQIDSSTESVGKYTTISVVNAIFWVIAMDAIISVLLTELGL